jgi:hypothetical protein
MTVTHADNYSRETFQPIDEELATFVTWQVMHDVDPNATTVDCFE